MQDASPAWAPARGSTARALAGACHPAPTVGVSAFAALLGLLAGDHASTVVWLVAAVLTGQLSIGWSNDRLDAIRDAQVGRRDKPIAAGQLAPRAVDSAIALALVATIGFSLALGLRAGLVHLGAVACGWAYNLGIKGTAHSWLPYAIAFGLLPGVATLAHSPARAPGWWLVSAGACIGVVANLTNALPDLADDQRTGVRGAPHRLGASRSLIIASGLLLGSSVLIVVGPRGSPGGSALAGLGLAVTLATVGCGWALRHPQARATFLGLFVFVALQLALLAATSDHLR